MDQDPAAAHVIEFFHLAFLQVLQTRLQQTHYAVKGGASLRYFFESPRYSEDIDLDAIDIETWRLKEAVDRVLASSAIDLLLRGGGLEVSEIVKHKQTETTQRWKPMIDAQGRRAPLRTRIEFSHGGADSRRILEAVPDRIVAPYALRPPTMLHYTAPAAIEQKVTALALRPETQARDVFDLELLVEAFHDQVAPFLDPEIADLYHDRAAWDQMRGFVIERLGEMG